MPDLLELQSDGQRIALEVGGDGRAVSWRVDGMELLGAKSTALIDHGMYAMGPWAGRIRDNELRLPDRVVPLPATHEQWALHGTTLGTQCTVVSSDASSAVVDLDLGRDWPFSGVLRAHWHLTADRVTTRLELIANDAPFPGVIGWHPWFERRLRGADAKWGIDGALLAERDSDYALTGRLVTPTAAPGTFDDAFRGEARRAHVEWPGVLRIDIASSHPWFVVFDQTPGALCVEPQTGPPNGVNDGLGDPVSWTRPGQPIRLDTEWRITRAQRPR